MRYVEAGGVRLSSIGLGCWQFGSRDWGYGKSYGDTTAVDLVHWALDHDVNLIDTAEVYARGASEAIVGRALEGRRDDGVPRDEGAADLADREPGRGARPDLVAATRRRDDRSLPGALAEPARLDRVDHGRHAAAAGERDHPPRRGEQLLRGPLGRGGARARWAGALEPGAVQPAATEGRQGERPVRAAQRSHRHRLQPARAGSARRALRRVEPSAGPGPV